MRERGKRPVALPELPTSPGDRQGSEGVAAAVVGRLAASLLEAFALADELVDVSKRAVLRRARGRGEGR